MSKTLTIIGHRANLVTHLRRLADQIEADEDFAEWVVEAGNNPRDGELTIRVEQEFEEDDDPTIVWDISEA